MAHSSRGLGHVPLKEEITGSNPVCATKDKITPCFEAKFLEQGVTFYRFATNLLLILFNGLFFTPRVEKSIKALCCCLLKSRGDMGVSI